MIRSSRHAHPNSEVELPLRAHIQIGDGENLLLLLLHRVEAGDRTERAIVLEARIDDLRHMTGTWDATPAGVVLRAVPRFAVISVPTP